mmetsp:Transcript_71235/g.118386  ORF Transcript_71235/g.118386 Transcript_71235/m.118386 type:complete len:593 (+) Transcript_71235:16-1794(+)
MAHILQSWLGERCSVESFHGTIWEKKPWHVQRSDPSAFNGVLTLDDFDALCTRASLDTSAELLIFKDLRQVYSYATPHAAFADGASLIINHADKVWPPLNRLCAELGGIFRHAYANVYLTPFASQTAPPHSDDRDVFILQVCGRKAWRVWSDPPEGAPRLPLNDEVVGKGEKLLTPEELGDPVVVCDLGAGDLLYIPRGAPHVAVTAHDGSSCSLHVTVAVPTADLSWHGFLLQAASTSCLRQRQFRQCVPLGPLPHAIAGHTQAVAGQQHGPASVDTSAGLSGSESYGDAIDASSGCKDGRCSSGGCKDGSCGSGGSCCGGGGNSRGRLANMRPSQMTLAEVAGVIVSDPHGGVKPEGCGSAFGQHASFRLSAHADVNVRLHLRVYPPKQGEDIGFERQIRAELSLGGLSVGNGRAVGSGRLGAHRRCSEHAKWYAAYVTLWREAERAMNIENASRTLHDKMVRRAREQRIALDRTKADLAACACHPQLGIELRSSTELRKTTNLEVITQAELVVAQTLPQTGQGRSLYAFLPEELRAALSTFAMWPCGKKFKVLQLPARHAFLQACATRMLIQLEVVKLVSPMDSQQARE